jgi:NitT/TauT family transport system permease protein
MSGNASEKRAGEGRERWGAPISAWPLRFVPSAWDLLALVLVLGILALLAWGSRAMTTPFTAGETLGVSLNPAYLPGYAGRTVLRMAAALVLSLAFSLAYAALAAKNRQAEKVLIPLLDILQSVPILGYLSITVTGFMALFPGSLLGVECAAIFAIFTSQAWNITFSLYQSFTSVPRDLVEAASMYHLTRWQRFWRLEVPFAIPAMVWNMMMSISGGWFFVVASEAISVSNRSLLLPGIGSYIALAIQERNLAAVGASVLTMLIVVLIYDQLLFRPLLAWCEKFRFETVEDEDQRSAWLLTMFRRSPLMRALGGLGHQSVLRVAGLTDSVRRHRPARARVPSRRARLWAARAWNVFLIAGTVTAVVVLGRFVITEVAWQEVRRVFGLGLATASRVVAMILLASVLWVPVGVWIGLRPRLAQRVQPVVQFVAAFPVNLLFPGAVILIHYFRLNPEIWVSPLMILGTQWYILFNVIAGASAIPRDIHYVAQNLGLRGWSWWRRVALPAVFPAYVTGAVTASGGSWNASIVAEVVEWGSTHLSVTGLGAYIAHGTAVGDFPRIALGIGVLCLYVVLFNRVLWRPLFALAEERLRLD